MENRLSTHKKLVYETTIPIRWGDMDAYQHVNNTVYFRYCEQARCEWLEKLGYTVLPQGIAPVVINASCTFFAPMNYPGTVELRMYCGQPGRSSFETYYEMRLAGEDKLYCEGQSKVVWMDSATGKSAPVPDDLRALLTAYRD
jgi:acyl-CoA thioester hydrolase